MDKEREPIITDGGFSEKQMAQNVDKTANNDQVKVGSISGNIFVAQNKKKVKSANQQPR